MFYLDSTLLLLIPPLLLTLYAQWKVKSTFQKYAEVGSRKGMSGAQTAHTMAQAEGVPVAIHRGQGFLSDHFNPADNSLVLSPEVYTGRSLSALGVAAHELGHALQKRDGYWPMQLRSGLIPVANFGSQFSMVLFMAGLFMGAAPLQTAGIILFSLAVLVSLVTLPMEFDASARAMKLLKEHQIITNSETPAVKAVLGAAALTYVAAALTAVTHLVRLILISRSND